MSKRERLRQVTGREERTSSRWSFVTQFAQRMPSKRLLQLLPGLSWLALLGVALAVVILYSLLRNAPPQGTLEFTIANYERIFTTPLYLEVLWRSMSIALRTTAIGLLLAYPVAYHLAFVAQRHQNLLLLLVVLPMWTNIVVRTYAWRQILGENGVLNYLLVSVLGVFDSPVSILYTESAVVIGLIYVFFPFLVLPIYMSLDGIDRSHIEAAKNLGANSTEAFFEVTLPQSLPGVISGVTLVFVMAFGSFVTPQLLGGSSNIMISNLIAQMYGTINNWALGSALSVVFIAIVFVLLIAVNKLVGINELYNGDGTE